MGEAKRRKLAEIQSLGEFTAFRDAAESVGEAIRKLMMASSDQYGKDCYLHAALGQALLKDRGFECDIQVGEAAWRVGDGDGDVVAHAQGMTTAHIAPGATGKAYHAWLVYLGHVIDFTTYQLRQKGADLDAMDGGTTTVDWCPEMLILPRNKISSYEDVASLSAGLAYYQVRPALQESVSSGFTLDPEDLAMARLILANPQMVVIGPRNAGHEN